MKNKLKELDVDFIGGQEPITKEEELSISKFIQAAKGKEGCKQTEVRKEQLRKASNVISNLNHQHILL